MAMIFGANSFVPANTRLNNGYTLYDWVMRKNCFPAFWGRSISGDNAISEEELAFLRERNCKIALIMDDLTEAGVSAADGTQDALRAVEAAKALGVPAYEGIAIFAEIRSDWSVSHNWMIMFAYTLMANGYIPGFFGNTDSSKNFNFNRQSGHYMQATVDVDHYHAIFGATEPRCDGEPEVWLPYCPSDFTREDIGLWRCGAIPYGDIVAYQTYARDISLLEHMW